MVAPVSSFPAGGMNKNLDALYENHSRGPVRWRTDDFGDRQWAGGAYPLVCLEGSTRSGKTWSWIEYVINACKNMPGLVCSAFRHDASTHERAAIRDFKRLMLEQYRSEWNAGKWNNQLKTFTFANGAVFEFCGTNDAGKLHGPERDIAILNEVMEISIEAYRQIKARTRLMVIMDWNPSLRKHWVFDQVIPRDDVLYVHSTYRDNPHLTDKQIAEIECTNPDNPRNVANGTADEWYWQVYGLGKRGRREGAIFKDYDIVYDWPDRMLCQRWGFGLDFGFSSDPAALIECALFQQRLWLREWIYDTGLLTARSMASPNTPSIEGILIDAQFSKRWKVAADCARPDNIAELVSAGYNVFGVPKGPDSIVGGLQLMQRFPICVHHTSVNIQQELDQYSWARHADGTWLDKPEDRFNHAMDAARYWSLDQLRGMPFEQATYSIPAPARKLKRYS